MKKILMIIVLLTSLPVYSACSVEEGGTCKVADLMNQPMQRTFGQSKPMIKEFSGTPEVRLKPAQNEPLSEHPRNFGPKTTDYSYDNTCQFGVCQKNGVPTLFPDR